MKYQYESDEVPIPQEIVENIVRVSFFYHICILN